MKIVIDNRIPGLEEGIRTRHPEWEVRALEGSAITRDDVADADALIVRTRTACDASLLKGSRVSLVGTATIGTDHIDLEWCEENGVDVASAPGCNAPAVMQYVASTLHEAGFDPKTQTLGVIGKGHVGSLVTELYRKAGTRVLVCDPPRREAGFTDEDYLTLEEVLAGSDAVTFHVPYTKGGAHPTHHLLGGTIPERPAIIVNASRGSVADPGFIIREGGKRKLIIDTWPFEEYPEEYDNEGRRTLIEAAFIATPHIAGYSIEGKRRGREAMLRALERHFGNGEVERIETEEQKYEIPSLERVIASFDPLPLSKELKANPEHFERQRGSHLRPEA